MEEARESALRFVNVVSGWFKGLSPASPDYEYFKRIDEIMDRINDLDHLVERSPYISIGTPEFLVDRFRPSRGDGLQRADLADRGHGPRPKHAGDRADRPRGDAEASERRREVAVPHPDNRNWIQHVVTRPSLDGR